MKKLKKVFENKTVMLLLIVFLALILRIIRALEMNRYDVDCYIYFNMAINWAKYGAEYAYQYSNTYYCPPLFPWLMSLGYKFGIQPDATALFLGVILGSIIPLCLYYVVNNLFAISISQSNIFIKNDVLHNDRAKSKESRTGAKNSLCAELCKGIIFNISNLSLLAAFLSAVHPSLVRISVRCLRDTLYIPLVAIALVCAVSAIKTKSVLKWCLFAFTSALASLVRYEGYELIIIFILWFILEIVINQKIIGENLKYYCCSFFSAMIIFSVLNLSVSYSLSQTRYTNQFFSIIESIFKT